MAEITSQRPGINGWSPEFLEATYESWRKNPGSVDPQWDYFFRGFELAASGAAPTAPSSTTTATPTVDGAHMVKMSHVQSLVYHYRDIGHLQARLDPLGRERPRPAGLELEFHELSPADLNTEFTTTVVGVQVPCTLKRLVEHLEATYCRHLGLEYMHIQNTMERRWFQSKLESEEGRFGFSPESKQRILHKLHQSEMFESFLHRRYPNQKRFSLEGSETLIPILACALDHASTLGIEESVLGMAHRGRLNVLANILQKGYDEIFAEFEDNYVQTDSGGDVKYHKGYSSSFPTENGSQVYLTLVANPSHLEAVDPVVLGRARAKQRLRNDKARKQVLPILIHGDAAFCGQGIVAEILQMMNLPGYTTGGTLHIIVNNQIGFTTDPSDSRSSTYCTDFAKIIQSPVLHVNGDDPEACVRAVQIALEYRQQFAKDVVVDMWCYRKWGHNESDEPAFTQPRMYDLIRQKKLISAIYAEQLKAEGVIDESFMAQMQRDIEAVLDEAQQYGKANPVPQNQEGYKWAWEGYGKKFNFDPVATAVPAAKIRALAEKLASLPEGFTPNPKVLRVLQQRREAALNNKPMDWGAVELLAYATLLDESIPVRLSGQDSRRGTFTHRHAVLTDMITEVDYNPLDNLKEVQPRFCVYDSPLAEASVLGFEYGYSLGDPNMLVIWEAQFGDFANGAQAIIDQFIVSAEVKWDRSSGLVMLLPHGYEGQGPEHSSARLERFLQLCAQDNIQVINPTLPAQYFHAIRRQMKRNFRKPLIVMTPKKLLRYEKAVSTVDDLAEGTFQEILDDPAVKNRGAVRRVFLCSGKVYFDLINRRSVVQSQDTAILRLEQIYPLHTELLQKLLASYPAADEFYWVQEEPKNMGAWTFISDLVEEKLGVRLNYIGRPASATPAVGSPKMHEAELKEFLEAAFPAATPAPAVAVV